MPSSQRCEEEKQIIFPFVLQQTNMILEDILSDQEDSEEMNNLNSLQDQQSISLSTIGGASKATNSVLTSDETVVRRGDGAQVTSKGHRLKDDGVYESSMVDVLTKMAIGEDSPKSAEMDGKVKNRSFFFCCCRGGKGSA